MRSNLKRNEITFSGVQLQSSKKGQASLKVANRCLKAIRWSSHSNGPNIVSLAALFKGQWSILKTSNFSNFDTLSFHVKKIRRFCFERIWNVRASSLYMFAQPLTQNREDRYDFECKDSHSTHPFLVEARSPCSRCCGCPCSSSMARIRVVWRGSNGATGWFDGIVGGSA